MDPVAETHGLARRPLDHSGAAELRPRIIAGCGPWDGANSGCNHATRQRKRSVRRVIAGEFEESKVRHGVDDLPIPFQ
jgi:hypothetical protein